MLQRDGEPSRTGQAVILSNDRIKACASNGDLSDAEDSGNGACKFVRTETRGYGRFLLRRQRRTSLSHARPSLQRWECTRESSRSPSELVRSKVAADQRGRFA